MLAPTSGTHKRSFSASAAEYKVKLIICLDTPESDSGLELRGPDTIICQNCHHSFSPYGSWLHEMLFITDEELLQEANHAANKLALQAVVPRVLKASRGGRRSTKTF